MLQRYAEKGELPRHAPAAMARQIIYLILMAFQDTLLGRHVPLPAPALGGLCPLVECHVLPTPSALVCSATGGEDSKEKGGTHEAA